MKRPHKNIRGFTITEIMIAMIVGGMVSFAALSSWIFINFSFKKSSVQSELDIDVRIAMENLKRDLRLSSMEDVVFYPQGPGPYTAISFPKANDDDGDGLVDLDEDNNIIWDETIVFHVYVASPNELRRTLIPNRDNEISDSARYQELVDVVTSGDGPSGSNTRSLFKNLFEWELKGKGGVIDTYGETIGKKSEVLGGALVSSGAHTLTFKAVGKTASSAGFHLGLDSVTISPSQSTREAEAQTVSSYVGNVPTAEYMDEGAWSGNYQLAFEGSGVDDQVTLSISNDRWEETNFTAAGYEAEGAEVVFDLDQSPSDFIVRLEGDGLNWFANEQAGVEPTLETAIEENAGATIRTLIKGGDVGGRIQNGGGNPWVRFRAPSEKSLRVESAYIAESASAWSNVTANTVGPSVPLVRYASSTDKDFTLTAGSYLWVTIPNGVEFLIDDEKSYAITFVLANGLGHGGPIYHQNPSSTVTESYVISKDDRLAISVSTTGDELAQLSSWAGLPKTAESRLYGIDALWPEHAPEGYYTSPVFDTKTDSPSYQELSWNENNESDTSLELKVRTGSDLEMSDASAWSNLTSQAYSGSLTVPSRRYVQFQAMMTASDSGWQTPRLKDVAVSWTAPVKVNDISATYTTDPSGGIYEVLLDGNPLVKGITASLEIYEEVPVFMGEKLRLTSKMTEEIEPRNSKGNENTP